MVQRLAPSWLSGYAGVILLLAVLVNLATQLTRNAFGLVLPSMRDSLGLSHTQEGILITGTSILGMVASFSFGLLASRYGSRYIVGISAIAASAATFLLGMSPSFVLALAASAAVGFTTGGCSIPVMGLLSSWFSSSNRGAAAGIAAAGGGFSFIIVGALVPWLEGRNPEDGWRHTWYVLAAIVLAIGVLSLVFLRERPRDFRPDPRMRGAWPMAAYTNPLVWLIALFAFCSGWCNGLYTTFFGEYLKEQGISLSLTGKLFSLLGLLGIGSAVFWGGLSDRLGRRAGYFLSFITYLIGCLLFWIAPEMAGFVASVVLMGISMRATYTICAAAAGDYVETRFSAAAFGLMGMGAGLGGSIGPPLGGVVADATGDLAWPFILATAGAVLGLCASVFLRAPAAVGRRRQDTGAAIS